MPLSREQILALREEYEQEFGSGEAEWADTTPEGRRLWERTHPPRWDWFIDSNARESFRVTCSGYGLVSIDTDNNVTGNVSMGNTGSAAGHMTKTASSAPDFASYVYHVGATILLL